MRSNLVCARVLQKRFGQLTVSLGCCVRRRSTPATRPVRSKSGCQSGWLLRVQDAGFGDQVVDLALLVLVGMAGPDVDEALR